MNSFCFDFIAQSHAVFAEEEKNRGIQSGFGFVGVFIAYTSINYKKGIRDLYLSFDYAQKELDISFYNELAVGFAKS